MGRVEAGSGVGEGAAGGAGPEGEEGRQEGGGVARESGCTTVSRKWEGKTQQKMHTAAAEPALARIVGNGSTLQGVPVEGVQANEGGPSDGSLGPRAWGQLGKGG